jgi:hypothetical protein
MKPLSFQSSFTTIVVCLLVFGGSPLGLQMTSWALAGDIDMAKVGSDLFAILGGVAALGLAPLVVPSLRNSVARAGNVMLVLLGTVGLVSAVVGVILSGQDSQRAEQAMGWLLFFTSWPAASALASVVVTGVTRLILTPGEAP